MSKTNLRTLLLVRKAHSYLGLFLLIELWIFSASGLMLNHPKWEISQFWSRRQIQEREVPLPATREGDAEAKAAELKEKLGIEGELGSLSWPSDLEGFRFNVVRPSLITTVVVDTAAERIRVQRISTDLAGLLNMLHTFNGVDFENGGQERDWFVTTLWTITMDLLSLAVIFWVVSGVYLWMGTGRRQQTASLLTLGLGSGLGLLLLVGPGWIF